MCSHSKLPCSLCCPLGIHVSVFSKVCRVRHPFGAFSPNLNIIATGAVYKAPDEPGMFFARVNRNRRRDKTSWDREFGWKGERLLSYAELVI
jgi:hypothetical protein